MQDVTEQKQSLTESVILIVEDDPINALVIEDLLRGLYQTKMVDSGEKALSVCESEPPDLILLDVMMDGISGLETCKVLKSNNFTQHIPIIFITSMHDQDDQNRCWEAGCVDFVSKPVNGVTLRNRIKAHLTLKLQTDLLRRMSFVDGLTGLYNRHLLEEVMVKFTSQVNRTNQPLSIMMIDVDWFKGYNDTYGHLVGDECLKSVANVVKSCLQRPTDMAIRYGGEEFLCLLPDTNEKGVEHIANIMLKSVQNLGIAHKLSEYKVVTISIGVHTVCSSENAALVQTLAKADEALFTAKQMGRNRFSIYTSNN
ncbi:diguanylate cyclase [uncultured Paraglaciecola sp.]|uniref:GGDEF domain-containing response regulator n=1 Tax=uncultured Paraglaciecola sp. TaxID=1765024 RepID=UPI002635D1B7|nr:diguanylate cyclase [uncultured Paraglaciecola sp.]